MISDHEMPTFHQFADRYLSERQPQSSSLVASSTIASIWASMLAPSSAI